MILLNKVVKSNVIFMAGLHVPHAGNYGACLAI